MLPPIIEDAGLSTARLGDIALLAGFNPVNWNGSALLCIAPGLGEQIADRPSSPIIVECEKKALAGVQAGFCCMAIGGIGTLVQKGKPIPDVDILP